ncbi:unnamed protein product, partial [marine sediment metagenome]
NSTTLVDYSDAEAIFSTRAVLPTNVVSYIIRVKRLSDNVETDVLIPTTQNGMISDESLVSAGGSLIDWHSNGNNTIITKWYDQKGNGHDLSQAVVGSSIIFISSATNTIQLFNGFPALPTTSGSIRYLSKGSSIAALDYLNDFTVLTAANLKDITFDQNAGFLWTTSTASGDRLDNHFEGVNNLALGTDHSKTVSGASITKLSYTQLIQNTDANLHILVSDTGVMNGFHNDITDSQGVTPQSYQNSNFATYSPFGNKVLGGNKYEHIIFATSKMGDLD